MSEVNRVRETPNTFSPQGVLLGVQVINYLEWLLTIWASIPNNVTFHSLLLVVSLLRTTPSQVLSTFTFEDQQDSVTLRSVTIKEGRYYNPLCVSHNGRSLWVNPEPQVSKIDPEPMYLYQLMVIYTNWWVTGGIEGRKVSNPTITFRISGWY